MVHARSHLQARVWDAYRGRCLAVLEGHTGRINRVALDKQVRMCGRVRLGSASVLPWVSVWMHFACSNRHAPPCATHRARSS
jgi:hypothetical protein